LQEGLFQRHSQIRYLGQTNLWDSADAKAVLKTLITGEVQADFSSVLQSLQDETRAVVISDEALTFGELMLRGQKWSINSDHTEMAQRIHQMLGEVDILLVLRRQDAWLESWHKQGLKTGRYIDPDFETWLLKELDESEREKLFSLLDYDTLVSAYANQFGQSRCHLFFFEDYQDRFEVLARELADRLEIDADQAEQLLRGHFSNISGDTYKGGAAGLKRISRSWFGRMLRQYMPSMVKKLQILTRREHRYKPVADHVKQSVLSHFRLGNQRLMNNLGRSDPYGY